MRKLKIRKSLTVLFIFINFSWAVAQSAEWKVVPGKILTPWAEKVDPNSVLPEHPRPQMTREAWTNLNGLWAYSISNADAAAPQSYEGNILVPFAIESALSGVGKRVGKDQKLWYKKNVRIPASVSSKKRVLLHFGAVDWKCEVWVNGKSVGSHEGGYDPFYFDITPHLKKGEQEIVVSVWDPSDEGHQPRGKQVKNPNSIWYTPVTGIWQTVWLEGVADTYISALRNTPDLDQKQLRVQPEVQGWKAGDKLRVSAWDGNAKVAEGEFSALNASLSIPNPKAWSPETPHLYDLRVAVVRKGKVVDETKGYFAMRKISMKPDSKGIQRMLFNNEFLFQYGPLDQGWWPDGLYTAPSDEALKFDIEKTKEMGFNMIRKHVKVEPARWYYHCDRLGLLVWQDMPSGDMGNHWESRPGVVGIGTDKERTSESEQTFKKEWTAIMKATYNFPSIVVWVPFNEAWGQFKTDDIVALTMKIDSSRLINAASGGNFVQSGHIIDLHNYPAPAMPDPELFGKKQILVLGEYGGLGLPVEGHTWQDKNNWGYQSFSSREELATKYETFSKKLQELIKQGLSAAVYTQTTDVEIETNGLMTYDRRVIKIPESKLHGFHSPFYQIKIQ